VNCLAPDCPNAALGAGHWPFLCVEHALVVARVREREIRRANVDLRGRCWGEAITCPFPATGGWCDRHAPEMPTPTVHPPSAVEEVDPTLLEAALTTMRILGASPMRTERRYGYLETRTVRVAYSPTAPCEMCGSTRSSRALFGLSDGRTALMLCTVASGCYGRLRKAKGATDLEETA
jgi:hypothetical protein